MRKSYLLTPVLVMIFIAFAFSSFAFMPETHELLNDNALNIAQASPVAKVIKEHKQDYEACTLLTDISVFYYFNEGFNAIGKEYKATHSQSLCLAMVADAKNNAELACAYGVCSHLIADSVSHNLFVPQSIRDSHLPNALVHVFAEERVNDLILQDNPQYIKVVRDALVNKAPVHKEFFRRVLIQQGSAATFNFDAMYDAFVAQVSADAKYTVGFKGFSAIPNVIHLFLILFAILNLALLIFLIKRGSSNIFSKILIIMALISLGFIIFIYVSFSQGQIWKVFEAVSSPVSAVVPVNNMESSLQLATDNLVQFMSSGASYIITVQDPAGNVKIGEANNSIGGFLTIIIIIMFLAVGFIIYKALRRR